MSRARWHIQRDGARLVLARRAGARWDVAAHAELPDAGRLRIAQQVRQDMWRALRRLKGFSPVVEVRREAGRLQVTAGGEVAGRFAKRHVEETIQGVLDCPLRRARWLAHAAHREVRHG